MILWRGHCSVHGRFTLSSVDEVRERVPGVNVLVHPECRYEVVDGGRPTSGSTEYIIKTIEAAPAGSAWAIGTELNLVRRLADAHPDKQIMFLDRTVCYCSTMNRIDLPHLVWALEELVAGRVPNQITVDPDTARVRPGGARPDARPPRRRPATDGRPRPPSARPAAARPPPPPSGRYLPLPGSRGGRLRATQRAGRRRKLPTRRRQAAAPAPRSSAVICTT